MHIEFGRLPIGEHVATVRLIKVPDDESGDIEHTVSFYVGDRLEAEARSEIPSSGSKLECGRGKVATDAPTISGVWNHPFVPQCPSSTDESSCFEGCISLARSIPPSLPFPPPTFPPALEDRISA